LELGEGGCKDRPFEEGGLAAKPDRDQDQDRHSQRGCGPVYSPALTLGLFNSVSLAAV
jgi:hypothetical protein